MRVRKRPVTGLDQARGSKPARSQGAKRHIVRGSLMTVGYTTANIGQPGGSGSQASGLRRMVSKPTRFDQSTHAKHNFRRRERDQKQLHQAARLAMSGWRAAINIAKSAPIWSGATMMPVPNISGATSRVTRQKRPLELPHWENEVMMKKPMTRRRFVATSAATTAYKSGGRGSEILAADRRNRDAYDEHTGPVGQRTLLACG